MIGRCITRAKTRSAKRRLYNRSCRQKVCNGSILYKLHINRRTCRINTERKGIRPDISAPDNVRCRTDIFKAAAGTSGNNPLLYIEFSIPDLILEGIRYRIIKAHSCLLLYIMENICQVGVYLLDGICIAWVERHRDHRTHLAQIHIDHAIIVCHISRCKLLILTLSSVDLVEFPDYFIRLPDGGQASRLRCHHIDTNPEIRTQLRNAWSYELHDFIIHIAVLEYRLNNGKGDVLGAHALYRPAIQIDGNDTRHPNIVGLIQKLLDKLRSALSHRHGAKRPITSMAV